jgi:hypothetical protein
VACEVPACGKCSDVDVLLQHSIYPSVASLLDSRRQALRPAQWFECTVHRKEDLAVRERERSDLEGVVRVRDS